MMLFNTDNIHSPACFREPISRSIAHHLMLHTTGNYLKSAYEQPAEVYAYGLEVLREPATVWQKYCLASAT